MQPELAVVSLPVAALVPYAENARTHSPAQVAQIASSIAEFGFVNPVLVDGSGVLVAGHGRVMAAKRLGMASVPAIRLAHLTEPQARALRLADNHVTNRLPGWNHWVNVCLLNHAEVDKHRPLGFHSSTDGRFDIQDVFAAKSDHSVCFSDLHEVRSALHVDTRIAVS